MMTETIARVATQVLQDLEVADMRFRKALEHLLLREGFYANVKNDNGKETYCGVARAFHPYWSGWKHVDAYKRHIRKTEGRKVQRNERIENDALDQAVASFYLEKFWQPIMGDMIHDEAVAMLLFDSYVHSGSKAVKWVQQAANQVGSIGVAVDWKFGGKTLLAVNLCNGERLFNAMKQLRKDYLTWLADNVADQAKFKRGWLRRINHFTYV